MPFLIVDGCTTALQGGGALTMMEPWLRGLEARESECSVYAMSEP